MPTALYRFRPYFYPRPPRGGRQLRFVVHCQGSLFLSTPSARRATVVTSAGSSLEPIFLSTPSARRATRSVFAESIKCTSISIHALREEGDLKMSNTGLTIEQISIHALREEGDFHLYVIRKSLFAISIHALREEGDGRHLRRVIVGADISIHALREEGDACGPCRIC